jgi:adenylate cyclase
VILRRASDACLAYAHTRTMDRNVVAIDFEAEGLLDGLEGEQRAERLALLERLAADGWSLDELRRASATDTLMFLPAERVIVGPERYTPGEIAQRAGVEREFLETVRRAMGLTNPEPDEAIFTTLELEGAQMIRTARDAGVSDTEIIELTRVLGRALSQVADAARRIPLARALEPGISEYDLASGYAQAVAYLHPMLEPLLANALSLHLRQGAQTEVISALERSGGELPGSREVSPCFADLVGFTRLGEEVAPEELGALATRLEVIARELVRPPVQLVKTIGDAVMLCSGEPQPILDTALALLDAAEGEGEEFPQLRAGAALGRAVTRAGDWFGRPVNLASRITQIARPGSLLAERELRESAADAYRWSYAGERRLRGVREPVRLFRARELEDGVAADSRD